jgi:glycosyltransferase involved in cell wall biosynthesis
MKILFINKYDTRGGAAIAAWRLHEQLETGQRTENAFLVGIKKSDSGQVLETRKAGLENFLERSSNFVLSRLGLQYFWFPFSTRRIRRLAKRLSPDVISLHNIHGGYFPTFLVHELSELAPVVWTLHDMWAFTANAAHTFGDESWKEPRPGPGEHRLFPTIGLRTGKWLLRRKKRIYRASNLTVVTPSRWLYGLASQSPLLEGKRVVQIYNGIDLHKYRPGDRSEAKKSLGIDPGINVLSFSAEKLMDSEHKGGDTLLKVLHALDEAGLRLCVVTMGGGHVPGKFRSLQIREMGYLSDEKQYIRCLQASDVYMHPAKADTLPNTLIEAIGCATPCVVFDIGGCPEIIREDENGFVVPPGDFNTFAKRVQQLLVDPALRERYARQARCVAEADFDLKKTAARYFSLFQEVSSIH